MVHGLHYYDSFLSSEILQNPTGHQEVPLLDVIPNDIHVGTAV